jgi:electron transfer flavoprotein alpha subunit
MNRIRVERRRPAEPRDPGGRIRRDPRAERLGLPAPQHEPRQGPSLGASGRIRRDPHASRGLGSAGANVKAQAAIALRRIVIDDPTCLIFAVPGLEDGRLSSHDRDLLGAARLLADAMGGAVVALVPGIPQENLGAAGADRLLSLPLPSGYAPEASAAAVLAAIERLGPRHVLFPESPSTGGDLGRRVACALGVQPAAQVIRLSADTVVSRGNGGLSDFSRAPPRILLIAPEVADPVSGAEWEARVLPEITTIPIDAHIVDGGLANTDPNAVPLPEADFILGAGNGVTDFAAFHELAAALGAAEGGSRVVCDAGLLPRSRQIGASGSLVEPRCYIALGIAGAPQHLQGILRCERVLAVNTDLHADMVKRADLAVIGDAQAVMPALAKIARERLRGKEMNDSKQPNDD